MEGLFERLSRTILQFAPPPRNGPGSSGRTRVLQQTVVGDEFPLLSRRQFKDIIVNLRPQHRQHLPSGVFLQLPQPRAAPIGLLPPMQFENAEPQFRDLSQQFRGDQRGHRLLVHKSRFQEGCSEYRR